MADSRRTLLRFASASGYAASAVLVFIAIILLPLGERARLIEMPYPVTSFIDLLDQSGRRVAVGLACDDLFVILYLSFFIGLARLSSPRGRGLAWLGLGGGLATGGLDLWENARLLAMIENVGAGFGVTRDQAYLTCVIGQVKFCAAYLALFSFAPGVWAQGRLGRSLAVMFVVFAAIGPFAFVSDVIGAARIPLMAIGLAVGGVLLGRAAAVDEA